MKNKMKWVWFLNLTGRRGSGWSQGQVSAVCGSAGTPTTSENQVAVFVWHKFGFLNSLGTWFSPGNIFSLFNLPYFHYLRAAERRQCILACKVWFLSWTPPFLPLIHQNPALIPLAWPRAFPRGGWRRTRSRFFSELQFFCGEENVPISGTRSSYLTASCSDLFSSQLGLGSS